MKKEFIAPLCPFCQLKEEDLFETFDICIDTLRQTKTAILLEQFMELRLNELFNEISIVKF